MSGSQRPAPRWLRGFDALGWCLFRAADGSCRRSEASAMRLLALSAVGLMVFLCRDQQFELWAVVVASLLLAPVVGLLLMPLIIPLLWLAAGTSAVIRGVSAVLAAAGGWVLPERPDYPPAWGESVAVSLRRADARRAGDPLVVFVLGVLVGRWGD